MQATDGILQSTPEPRSTANDALQDNTRPIPEGLHPARGVVLAVAIGLVLWAGIAVCTLALLGN